MPGPALPGSVQLRPDWAAREAASSHQPATGPCRRLQLPRNIPANNRAPSPGKVRGCWRVDRVRARRSASATTAARLRGGLAGLHRHHDARDGSADHRIDDAGDRPHAGEQFPGDGVRVRPGQSADLDPARRLPLAGCCVAPAGRRLPRRAMSATVRARYDLEKPPPARRPLTRRRGGGSGQPVVTAVTVITAGVGS